MGESSDLGYATLNSMSNNFIRLETLKEANDKVSNTTAGLAIFHHYDIGFFVQMRNLSRQEIIDSCFAPTNRGLSG